MGLGSGGKREKLIRILRGGVIRKGISRAGHLNTKRAQGDSFERTESL